MRYVIVCLIKGDALKFHENLVQDVCRRYTVSRQRLPAHFTLKAPFETDQIVEVEELIRDFCANRPKTRIGIEGFDHFREDVVFMDIKPSNAAMETCNDFVDVLKGVPWLEWKRNEGRNKRLHCTIVTKIPNDKYYDIWNYVREHQCSFDTYFDNISILKWDINRWVTYREFNFKD